MSEALEYKCPIWGTPAILAESVGDDYGVVNSSRAGGRYLISGTAVVMMKNQNEATKRRLSLWVWEENTKLKIDSSTDRERLPKIYSNTIDEKARLKKPTLDDLQKNVLRHLLYHSGDEYAKKFGFIRRSMDGFAVNLYDKDIYNFLLAASFCLEKQELGGFLWDLAEQGYLRKADSGELVSIQLSVEGRQTAEELKDRDLDSSKAFVAMWFDKSMNSVYEKAIKPAIEEMGYKPIRIDRENYNNKVDDEIIANLLTSRFIVADFTHGEEGVRGGVYYEAGFAHGLDIPVIFTCRKDMDEEIHFDTRQFNHIFWEDEEDLKKRLIDRIGVTIGQGPEKKEDASQA